MRNFVYYFELWILWSTHHIYTTFDQYQYAVASAESVETSVDKCDDINNIKLMQYKMALDKKILSLKTSHSILKIHFHTHD